MIYIKRKIIVALLGLSICLSPKITTLAQEEIHSTRYAGISNILLNSINLDNVEATVEPNPNFVIRDTPSNNSFKSYMDANKIEDTTSQQFQLLSQYELSDIGVYVVDGRYCIAMGSYYTKEIGTKIDLVMENGSVVECILADCKADCDTDSTNRQNPNGSIAEFIVDTKSLSSLVKTMGNLSYAQDNLIGEIKYVVVYDD